MIFLPWGARQQRCLCQPRAGGGQAALPLALTPSPLPQVEFYLNIYFSIFPALPHRADAANLAPLAATMREFKEYLEQRGAALARTGEFLAYYALPFVPEPAQHPSFKGLFEPLWALEARERLETLLATSPDALPRPRLYNMYESHYGLGSEPARDEKRPGSAFLRGERELDTYLEEEFETEEGGGMELKLFFSPVKHGGGSARGGSGGGAGGDPGGLTSMD